MAKIEETLEQRGSIYGGYKDGVNIRASILQALKLHYSLINRTEMPVAQQIWVTDLIIKLVRASATPQHTDSIHDLIGYSKLIEEMLTDESTKTV